MNRDDSQIFLALEIQGVPEVLGTVDGPAYRTLFGARRIVPAIMVDGLALEYGRVAAWSGVSEPGHLSLELVDLDGTIAEWMRDGYAVLVRADVSATATTLTLDDDGGANITIGSEWHLHNECVRVDDKPTANTLTVTRNRYGIGYTPWHEITQPIYGASDITPDHYLRQTPYILEGRVCRLWWFTGTDWQNLWSGVVTAVPPSTSGIGFRLEADTPERMVLDKLPVLDVQGRYPTWADFKESNLSPQIHLDKAYTLSVQVQYSVFELNAGYKGTEIEWGSKDIELSYGPGLVWLNDVWVSAMLAISREPFDGSVLGVECTVNGSATIGTDDGVRLAGDIFGGFYVHEVGHLLELSMTVEGSILPRLQLQSPLTVQRSDTTDGTVGEVGSYSWRTEAPLRHTWTTPEVATYIPILSLKELPMTGTGKLGQEILSWDDAEVLDTQTGLQHIQADSRGLGGTKREEYKVVRGTDGPDLQFTGATLATQATFSRQVLAFLLGTDWGNGDKSDNDTTGASWDEFHLQIGAAIPRVLVDVPQIMTSEDGESLTPPAGEISNMRDWLSGGGILSARALATTFDGTDCKLRLIRTSDVAAPDETALECRIEAWHGLSVSGGLGDIRNILQLDGGYAGKADYIDHDSIATYRVRQPMQVSYPVAGEEDLKALAMTAADILRGTGRRYYIAEFALGPEARFIAPGALVSITVPNPALSGVWRILSSRTALQGGGATVQVSAIQITRVSDRFWAPVAQVASAVGVELTFEASAWARIGSADTDLSWFAVGDVVLLYDPEAGYDTAVEATIDAIVDNVATLNTDPEAAAGWLMVHKDYETATESSQGMYLWNRTDATWGR